LLPTHGQSTGGNGALTHSLSVRKPEFENPSDAFRNLISQRLALFRCFSYSQSTRLQGSEYLAVVIPMAMQHYMLLERNLLYTGVIRGKQLVVAIAQPKALAMAVKNQRSQRRITNLISRLNQG
jgi:hypothetical protein